MNVNLKISLTPDPNFVNRGRIGQWKMQRSAEVPAGEKANWSLIILMRFRFSWSSMINVRRLIMWGVGRGSVVRRPECLVVHCSPKSRNYSHRLLLNQDENDLLDHLLFNSTNINYLFFFLETTNINYLLLYNFSIYIFNTILFLGLNSII